MSRMRLDDDRATGSQRTDRVRADDTDGERKIACAKNHHRTDRLQHTAHIRLWHRGTIRDRVVDAHLGPGTFTDQRGEHLALADGASAFTGESCHGQRRFLMGALQQGITQRHDFISEMIQQSGACLRRGCAQGIKSSVGRLQRLIRHGVRGFTKERGQLLIRRRIQSLKRGVISGRFTACDEMMSGEHGNGKGRG